MEFWYEIATLRKEVQEWRSFNPDELVNAVPRQVRWFSRARGRGGEWGSEGSLAS